jgi:lipoyl-dependent peroxiredoxin
LEGVNVKLTEKEQHMPTRTAEANWGGSLMEGKGTLSTGSKAFSGPYDWKSRSGEGSTTNPEELLAAAHAGCFSMALSHQLAQAGHPPKKIHTTAKVSFEKQTEGFAITKIELTTEGQVPGIDEKTFQDLANKAKDGCPVSKALKATPITLKATLGK